MVNYVIYGTQFSGMVSYYLLKKLRQQVMAFVDRSGRILDKRLKEKYKVYLDVNQLPSNILKDTDVILVALDVPNKASKIKNLLKKEYPNIQINSIFDNEYFEDFFSIREKVVVDLSLNLDQNHKDLERRIEDKSIMIRCSNNLEIRRVKTLIGEEDLLKYIFKKLKPGMVTYDIGANIGIYSLYLSKYFPTGQVHSFEPEVKNYMKIIVNKECNNINNIFPHLIALGDKKERKKLYLYSDLVGEGGNSLIPEPEKNFTWVDVWDMDSYLEFKNIPEPDFVKIDVEGFELEVLDGMKKIIEKETPAFLIEIHPKVPGLNDNITKFLQNYGYQINIIAIPMRPEKFIYAEK